MDQQQITRQVMESNKILLENTFAFAQIKKLYPHFVEKNSSFPEAKNKIINKPEEIYNSGYENFEISAKHMIELYKIADQEVI
jgi:hypothetical protein